MSACAGSPIGEEPTLEPGELGGGLAGTAPAPVGEATWVPPLVDADRFRRAARAGRGPEGFRDALVWQPAAPVQAIATTVVGGGVGRRGWVLNAQVDLGYSQPDPAAHVTRLAAALGLRGEGIGFLTAAAVAGVVTATDRGARCDATVGISVPTWAAGPDGSWSRWEPGTINLVCWVPAPLSDAALANALATATEAKVQALLEAGVPGTGTASDAVAVCCPPGGSEAYGGPRSAWGARLARAVHAAVAEGTARALAGGGT